MHVAMATDSQICSILFCLAFAVCCWFMIRKTPSLPSHPNIADRVDNVFDACVDTFIRACFCRLLFAALIGSEVIAQKISDVGR